MKSATILSLCFLLTPLVGQNQSIPTTQELLPNQQAFLNLPEARRKEFIKHIGEASRLFHQKRVFETMEELDKASAIYKDSSEIYNLRGSCYVEMRAFDKAMVEYNNAASISKDNPNLLFNIGEVNFVTKQWQKAHDCFQKVIKLLPPNDTALSRLAEFKILLCLKKLGKDNEVVILTGKYDYLDDSPFYYYAQAVLAYDNKDLMKAEEWLARANRIFRDPNILAPWQDTLVEYGYIKSFYGEETPTEE